MLLQSIKAFDQHAADQENNLSLPVTGPESGDFEFFLRKFFLDEEIEWFCP